jgi:hypothetical protein
VVSDSKMPSITHIDWHRCVFVERKRFGQHAKRNQRKVCISSFSLDTPIHYDANGPRIDQVVVARLLL